MTPLPCPALPCRVTPAMPCVIDSSTAENIVLFVWKQLQQALGDKARLLYEVSLEETENNRFTYRGE